MPAVDYYLPAQRVVVEFDESQHFTQLRRVALETYPATLRLGFDRHRWIELSRKLDRHDNDPYDRDETRAWYDTLRDFAGVGSGSLAEARPTVRLYARDEVWCQLDLSNRDVVRSLLTTYFNHVDRIGA